MANRKIVVLVPSALERRALAIEVNAGEFSRTFAGVFADPRVVLAQASPFLAYAIPGALILPTGVARDFRAHPSARPLPTAHERVTLIDLGRGVPTYRVVTRLKFIEAVARFESQAPDLFDAMVAEPHVLTWPSLAAVSWSINWLEPSEAEARMVPNLLVGSSQAWASTDANATGLTRPSGSDRVGEVRARRFVLEDPNGDEAAVLECDGDEPRLSLIDAEGNTRLQLQVTAQSGPTVALIGSDGSINAVVSGDPPTIRLLGDKGVMLSLDLRDDHGATVVVTNDDGQSLQLHSRSDGYGPGLALFDRKAITRFAIALGGPGRTAAGQAMPAAGEPVLGVSDSSGTPRLVIGQRPDGAEELLLLGMDGRVEKRIRSGWR